MELLFSHMQEPFVYVLLIVAVESDDLKVTTCHPLTYCKLLAPKHSSVISQYVQCVGHTSVLCS